MKRILAVVVIHKLEPSESAACVSVLHASKSENSRISGFVYDNTPSKPAGESCLGAGVIHRVAGSNRGLPAAYNAALQFAIENGYEFVLLLDQDSEPDASYFEIVLRATSSASESESIWVPTVKVDGRVISPFRFNAVGLPAFGPMASGDGSLYAINSFSVLRVSFLSSIGGFDQHYWLDALDLWLYDEARRKGRHPSILDCSVSHQLSLLVEKVPMWRLNNIALFESCFYWERMTILQAMVGTLRIAARSIRQRRSFQSARDVASYFGAIVEGFTQGAVRRRQLRSRGHF